MTTALLQTKLYIPPLRPDHISRPQLVRYLDEGLDKARALSLISAPAGYGKTTILIEWIHQRQMPVAWISIDEYDNEPALPDSSQAYTEGSSNQEIPFPVLEL